MKQPIIFDIDLDNKPIKDTIKKDNIDNLMFSAQYKQALQQINQYLGALTLSNDAKEEDPKIRDDYDYFDIDYNNNIFAFVGERGTGKTSCMISVADLLCSKRKNTFTECENIVKVNFQTIDLIDPSYFDSCHNVISLFLAKLYDSYKKHVEKDNKEWDIDDEHRTAFLEELSKAQKHLIQLDPSHKEESYSENSIEQLVALSSAVDLKTDIRNLVDAYNEVLGLKDSILILRIDDIDLNTENSAKMAEYIRKYFIQPNMIVLMSLKFEQLEAIKRNEFTKTYDKVSDEVNTADMAVKYMNKLIPQSQRIYMPMPQNYLELPLTIKSKSFSEDLSYSSIKLAVPELIFQKTRYLFYNSKVQNSHIIPRNLRDLRQIVKMLFMMPNYSKESPTNKEIFKNYFFSSWIEQHIEKADQHYLQEIINEDDILMLNSLIVNILGRKFILNNSTALSGDVFAKSVKSEIKKIISTQNMSYNISSGDVIGLVTTLESMYQRPSDINFLFFIRSLYSIRLYEAYDSVTEPQVDDIDEEKLIYRLPRLNNLTEYSKLTGGSLFNNFLMPLVSDLSASDSYIAQTIKGESLLNLMKECNDDWDSSLKKGTVMLVEFFMLCICGNSTQEDYRTVADAYYNNRTLSSELRFNLYSVFYNLTQLCYNKVEGQIYQIDNTVYSWPCYSRFCSYLDSNKNYKGVANAFLAKLLEHDNYEHKLWPHLMFYTLRDKQDRNDKMSLDSYDAEDLVKSFKPERWMSYCSFRNVEIMQDFAQYMSEDVYKDEKPAKIFYKFFDKVSKYSIKTYDRDENRNPYKITFRYAEAIRDVFTMKKNYSKITDILSDFSKTDPKQKSNEDQGKLNEGLMKEANNGKA